MVNRQMELLNSRDVIGRHLDRDIRQRRQISA